MPLKTPRTTAAYLSLRSAAALMLTGATGCLVGCSEKRRHRRYPPLRAKISVG